jgi:protein-S-isoprenylcysteine O-methyltransferase Ste14
VERSHCTRGRRWRWSNLPVPEGHVAALAASLCVERRRPCPLEFRGSRSVGYFLALAGTALVAWATRSAGTVDLSAPTHVVTSGPYGWSRHPMYVEWSVGYVGLSLVAATAWPLVLTPPLAVWTLAEARREERSLARAFGEEYNLYRRAVPALA